MAMAPKIQAEFLLSATELGLLFGAYYWGQTLGALPAGALTDRLGVRLALVLSLLLLAVGGLLLALSGGLLWAAAGTAVMGLGYSVTNPATAKGVLNWVPSGRRATAMGMKQTGVPLGGVLAAGNGVLVTWFDWRILMGAVALTGVVGALAMGALGREPGGNRQEVRSLRVPRSLLLLAKDRNVAAIFTSAVPWSMGHANFITFLTLFMRDAVRTSQPVAGLILALAQGASALGRIAWGHLSDTMLGGARKPLLVHLCGAASVFFIALGAIPPGWVVPFLLLAVALGLTVSSYQALQQALTVEAVRPELAASAMGLKVLGSSLGGMIGPPLFGLVLDRTGGFACSWGLTGLMTATGTLLLALWLTEGR